MLLWLMLLAGPKVTLTPYPKLALLNLDGRARFSIMARIEDGEDERYYCPKLEWSWPNGTKSTHEEDCPPFDKAEKDDHTMTDRQEIVLTESGTWSIKLRLLKAEKVIATQECTVTVVGQ